MTAPIVLKFITPIEDDTFEVTAELTLGKPAPNCSNPSSPAFSDPGEPDECEILSATPEGSTFNLVGILPEEIIEVLAERAWEAYHEQIPSETL